MKTLAILMATLLVFSAMPLVVAEETDAVISEDIELEDAGVTPDSPFYGLERAMERIRLAMTFDKAKKAKLHFKYAEERLAEAEEMADEDDIESAEEAQEAHDEGISEAQEVIDELETDGDEETAEKALEEVTELKQIAETHSQKVARIKNRILERKIAAGNLTEEQITHMRTVFNRIITKAQEMEAKMEQKRLNVRTKLKVLAELSDEELEELDSEIKERIEEGKEDDEDEVEESEESGANDQGQQQAGQQ